MSKIIGITAASNFDVDKIKKGADIYEVSSPEEIAADAPDGLYAVPNGGGGAGGGTGGTGCFCDTTELEQDIAELTERHQILEDDYMRSREQHSTQIKTLDTSLTNANTAIVGLDIRVRELENNGGSTGGGGGTGGTGGDTTELVNAIIKNTTDIAEHDHLISKNAGDITKLQTTVSGQATQINSIGANLTQTQRELDQLESKVDTFDGVGGAFTNLQNDLDEVERKVTSLEVFRDGYEENFDDLYTRVSDAEQKVSSLEGFRDSYEGNFDDLYTRVAENTLKISILSAENGVNDDILNQFIGDVNDNSARSRRNENAIGALRDDVDSLLETRTEHTVQLIRHSTAIEDIAYHEDRLHNIEWGFRDSVRLTGANGKQYKLTIDANGALVVSEVQYNHG